MLRRGIGLLFLVLLLLVLLIWQQWPDNKLHLVFCNVGQGDAVLITYKFNQALIDGGPDSSVLSCLSKNMPFWDRKIELVVLTHPEKDHFSGLLDVLARYQVKRFVANPFGLKNRPGFERLLKTLFEQKIYTIFLRAGDKIRLGKIQFDILWPTQAKQEELVSLKRISSKTTNGFWLIDESLVVPNEFSFVLHLHFGRFDALLGGDAAAEVSQTLAWRGELPKVEVLKAFHHGSKFDNPEIVYRTTDPSLVVFSVGRNRFGHPDKDLIDWLESQKIKVRRTDREGEIEVVSDGKSWWIDN